MFIVCLHVSGNYVPIIMRNYRTYATPGISHSIQMTVWYAGRPSRIPDSHLYIYSDKYQVSHRYDNFSWWWEHSCPKHVEKNNKHIKKICAPSWLYFKIIQGCTVSKTENRDIISLCDTWY